MRLDALEIDDHILDKIESVHGVLFGEVEEAIYSTRRHVRRGREGLYKVFSQTEAGRYLLVVLADKSEGLWRVVTARQMTTREKALYRRQMGD
ncbi:MAG TPA: BrnT family toxin [Dehalococcoidia bacterium]|nr:BrnT family toxin [Dehalococcoidia bacterium]